MTPTESVNQWRSDAARFAELGLSAPGVVGYMTPDMKRDFTLAMDAIPALSTAPNAGIPAWLSTLMDPTYIEVIFAPTKAAEIAGEVRKGTWVDETAIFPVVEHTGEVSSYGDYVSNGRAGVNSNFPQRQAYVFQTVKEYGDRELDRAGLAKLNLVSEIDKAAGSVLNRYTNLTYLYGVANLQNYGLLNDPNLPATITPAPKAANTGGSGTGVDSWFDSGAPNATANEVYNDVLSLFQQLVVQSGGNIESDASMTLVLPPGTAVALGFTNEFGLVARDIIKQEFPNLKIVTCPQYGIKSATNPNGVTGGNMMQLICNSVDGQDFGYCSYNERSRSFPIVRELSSYKQKIVSGTWGAIVRLPFAVAGMLGI
jgi:hypothetical protein